MSNNIKKTALDRKLDKIRAAEESGKLGTKLTNRTLRKLTSNKLAVIGILLFVVICVLCFGAPLFTKYDPMAFDLRGKMGAPSATHILGTDQMGRDIWSRILYGGRISLIIGVATGLSVTLLGATLGIVSAYFGKVSGAVILNSGDVEAKPRIKLTASGTSATVAAGGKSLTVTGLTSGYVYIIDSETCTATNADGTVNMLHNTSGGFPVLAVGENTVTGSGWSKIEMQKRERYL